MFSKKIMFTLLITCIAIFSVGIGYFLFKTVIGVGLSTAISPDEFRTEIQPITNRFPKLEKVESVYWKAGPIGKNQFGPDSYWMKGYVYLDKGSISSIKASYDDWEEVNGLKPLAVAQEHEPQWLFSSEFDRFIRTSTFVGKFYLDANNDVLYFEFER